MLSARRWPRCPRVSPSQSSCSGGRRRWSPKSYPPGQDRAKGGSPALFPRARRRSDPGAVPPQPRGRGERRRRRRRSSSKARERAEDGKESKAGLYVGHPLPQTLRARITQPPLPLPAGASSGYHQPEILRLSPERFFPHRHQNPSSGPRARKHNRAGEPPDAGG